ncbi:hypothetical protein D9Q98_008603 [Chlorella vulgaris]|uniref:V-type proton ATPase subunit G n=1 Tax=Chlorella vulgaris TaxID=3077 RepID=A0A9D4YUD8_CHLVU|nr:hypothetical protein D9Q98_008603 [Chlorella vulgaris]
MEVSAGGDGIQKLLAAEQDAQAIVARARKAKTERLKQAKDEAEREIIAYKREREAEFKRKVSDDSSSSQDNVTRLGEESAQAVQAIQESIASKKKDVMEMLMYHVTTVKLASE